LTVIVTAKENWKPILSVIDTAKENCKQQLTKMGFWGLSLAGAGFIMIGIWQAYSTAMIYLTRSSSSSSSRPSSSSGLYRKRPFYTAELLFIASLALLYILNAALSSYNGLNHGDPLVLGIQLEKSGVASLFLMYSVVGMICECTQLLPLPWEVNNLIAVFAFCEEFLVFYLQNEGSTGLEIRYYSLLLVPISVCIASKALEIPYPRSVLPPLGVALGLILQGTWFFQMGISFFTGWISHGCILSEKSGGDYTISCEHPADGHRGKAIATLQFNCHLALLLVCLLPAYSCLTTKYVNFNSSSYIPLGAKEQTEELQDLGGSGDGVEARFALDSDEDETHETLQQKHGTMSEMNGVNGMSV